MINKKNISLYFFLFISLNVFAQKATKDTIRELNMFEKEIFFYDKMSVGIKAPEFRFANMQGDSLILSKLKGKVVVLNAFFAQCPPCIKEIPLLNKIKQKYDNKEVVFIAVSRWDTKDKLIEFQTKHDLQFNIIPSEYKENIRTTTNAIFLEKTYLIPLYPTTIVIDQDGLISYTNVGFSGEADVNGVDYIIGKLLKR